MLIRWMGILEFYHHHGTQIKVVSVVLLIIGVAALATLPVTAPLIGNWVVAIKVAGSVLIVASTVSLLARGFLSMQLATFHHSMRHHVYKTGIYKEVIDGEEIIIGELKYHGDAPILTLNILDEEDESYFLSGKAHGYLLGRDMYKLVTAWNRIAALPSSITQLDAPKPHQIPNVLEELKTKIPSKYLKEMEGLVEGYNVWLKENTWFGKPLTVDDLLAFYLIPDRCHFGPSELQDSANYGYDLRDQPTTLPGMACTVIVDRDEQKGNVFARNLDWDSPFGIFGPKCVIFQRIHGNGFTTVGGGLPGIIGEFTGMNSNGVCVAMNVCSGNTQKVRGMPAALFNRYILENAASVEEAENLIGKEEYKPLGAYHLTIVDGENAVIYHMYQDRRIFIDMENPPKHIVSRKQDDDLLIENNCTYKCSENGEKEQVGEMFFSASRRERIEAFYKDASEKLSDEKYIERYKLAAHALSLPLVNNFETMFSMVMVPNELSMLYKYDNAFAAHQKGQLLTREVLFPKNHSDSRLDMDETGTNSSSDEDDDLTFAE